MSVTNMKMADAPSPYPSRTRIFKRVMLMLVLSILCVYLKLHLPALAFHVPPLASQVIIQPTPPPSFIHLASHCAHLTQLPASSFHARLTQLAQALQSLHASAYIAEPGANAQYYTNVSREDWQLSDRPMLVVIVPDFCCSRHEVSARIIVLVPAFDAPRAKLLPIPVPPGSSITWVEWTDSADPYQLIGRALGIRGRGVFYVDGVMRHFIVEGLSRAVGPYIKVRAAPDAITRIREKKDHQEIELMRCANEVTLLAIRDVRQHVRVGMRESEIQSLAVSALREAGLTSPTAVVLTGENTSLPRSPSSDRVLREEDMILLEAGGRLHGYWSHVTRTFALPVSKISPAHMTIWLHVYLAQTLASYGALAGVHTSSVDDVARTHVRQAGYGEMKHGVGHGIGLEAQESPYLRPGNAALIQRGHVFANQPGIYVEGEAGARLEDCFFVDAQGLPIWLTAGVGGQAQTPLEP